MKYTTENLSELHYSILRAIAEQEPTSLGQISRHLDLSIKAVNARVRTLSRLGLITREKAINKHGKPYWKSSTIRLSKEGKTFAIPN